MQRAALRAATNDIAVAERILRVRNLIDPPAQLQDPALFFRILLTNIRRRGPGTKVLADHASSVNRADEQAIRALIDRQVTGWDTADPDADASVFTPDADYVTFLGSRYKGRAAIASSYAPLFNKLLRGTRLHTQIAQSRYLTPDVALIHARAAVTKQGRRWNRRGERVTPASLCAPTTDGAGRLAEHHPSPVRRKASRCAGFAAIPRMRQDGSPCLTRFTARPAPESPTWPPR